MAEIQFHYDETSDELLRVTWQGFFGDMRVHLGDVEVGKVYAFEELLKGTEMKLPDAGTLRLEYGLGGLVAKRDGRPLPRTVDGQARALRSGSWALYFVGAQSVFIGLLMIFFRGSVFGTTAIGPVILVIGLVYIGLGVGVQRRSLAALVAAIGLYLLEAVVSIGLSLATGTPLNFITLVLRVVILGLLATALEPLGAFKDDD